METTTPEQTAYIMFENAGVADFYALYFVGFTDKKDDPAAIGMFGSGFKLAVASALRLNLELILYLGFLGMIFLEKFTRPLGWPAPTLCRTTLDVIFPNNPVRFFRGQSL